MRPPPTPLASRPPTSHRPLCIPTRPILPPHTELQTPRSTLTTTLNRLAIPKATSTCSVGAHYSDSLPLPSCRSSIVDLQQNARPHTAAADGPLMRVIGRLAESEDPVLFARFGEVDKCEFIKVNAPEEAWASTEDGAGLLVKADALREQAREVLVSAAPCRTSSLP